MWFGQKCFQRDGKVIHGRWVPFESHESAVAAGSTLVSILELCCTLEEYELWTQKQEASGKEARKMRPCFAFRGPFYADFDDPEDLAGLKKKLVKRLDELQKRFELEDEDFQLWFTGSKGFHLVLDPALFGATNLKHKSLPDIYKMFGCLLGLGDLMDPVVYSKGRGRLWRVEGLVRANGCRKVPISLGQLRGLGVNDLKKLAAKSWWYRPELRINPPVINNLAVRFDDALTLVAEREKERVALKKKKLFSPKSNNPDLDRLVEALGRLPTSFCNNYGDWLTIGMALHDGTGGSLAGLELWHDWSKQSEKYDPLILEHVWDSFQQDSDGVSVGTLFFLAGRKKQ